MKILRPGLFGILVSLCRVATAADDAKEPRASDFGEPSQVQTRYVVEVFKVPAAAAYDLISQDLKGADLHARMMEALKAGTATLDKLMAATTMARVTATFDQTEDYLYPTELDPPQIAQNVAIITPASKTQRTARPETGKDKEASISPFNGGLGTISTVTPTAFQTQKLGDTLEISPGVPDEHGRLPVSYTLDSSLLTALAPDPDLPGPVFSTRSIKSAAQLTPSQPAFLGTCGLARRTGVPQEHTEEVTSLAFVTVRPGAKAPAAQPESDAPDTPFRHLALRSTVEMVSMEKAAAHLLLLARPDDAALYQSVVEMIRAAGARRETTLSVRSQAGNEAKIDTGRGHMYPTEFDPPQIPQFLIVGNHELLRDLRAGRQTGIGAQPPMEGGNPNGGFGLVTTLSPTAFQRADLGEELQINVTCSGNLVDAVIALRICHLDGTVLYNGIKHPVFGRQNLSTSVRTEIGRPVFLGTLNKALNTGYAGCCKEDRIWLAFLRVTAR